MIRLIRRSLGLGLYKNPPLISLAIMLTIRNGKHTETPLSERSRHENYRWHVDEFLFDAHFGFGPVATVSLKVYELQKGRYIRILEYNNDGWVHKPSVWVRHHLHSRLREFDRD